MFAIAVARRDRGHDRPASIAAPSTRGRTARATRRSCARRSASACASARRATIVVHVRRRRARPEPALKPRGSNARHHGVRDVATPTARRAVAIHLASLRPCAARAASGAITSRSAVWAATSAISWTRGLDRGDPRVRPAVRAARIPRQLVVDDNAAVMVEIEALGRGVGGEQRLSAALERLRARGAFGRGQAAMESTTGCPARPRCARAAPACRDTR